MWGYVMPNLAYHVILGKPWMERNEVTYSAGKQSLRIGQGDNKLMVKTSRLSNESEVSYKELSEIFTRELKEAPAFKNELVGAILMYDITKALEPKKQVSRDMVKDSLPEEVRNFTELFVEDSSN